MPGSQQHSARTVPESSPIDAALAQVLRTHGCTPAQIAQAAAIWQEVVADSGVQGCAGSALAWYAALHYVVAPSTGGALTQKDLATRYRIAPTTLAARVQQLSGYMKRSVVPGSDLGPAAPCQRWLVEPWRLPATRNPVSALLAAARKRLPMTRVAALDDHTWIGLFSDTHRLVSTLYRDRSHIEILLYLAHVEVNLLLAGYQLEPAAILDQFGKLFPRLGLQAAKGRDTRKFVYLHDTFGRQEPFALLKLESEHE
jgi:hypothetical protein